MEKANADLLIKLSKVEEDIALMLEEAADSLKLLSDMAVDPSDDEIKQNIVLSTKTFTDKVNSICDNLISFTSHAQAHRVFNQSNYGEKKDNELSIKVQKFVENRLEHLKNDTN